MRTKYFCIVDQSLAYQQSAEEAVTSLEVAVNMIDQMTGSEGPVNTVGGCLTGIVSRCEEYGVKLDEYRPLTEVRSELTDRLAHARRCLLFAELALEQAQLVKENAPPVDEIGDAKRGLTTPDPTS